MTKTLHKDIIKRFQISLMRKETLKNDLNISANAIFVQFY